jgi:hypothetical protein
LEKQTFKAASDLPEATLAIEIIEIQNDQLVALAQSAKEELESMALQA